MGWPKTSLLIFLIILLILINLLKILLKPLWRFLLGSRLPLIVRTPAERFEGLDKLGYDFKENYLRCFLKTIKLNNCYKMSQFPVLMPGVGWPCPEFTILTRDPERARLFSVFTASPPGPSYTGR